MYCIEQICEAVKYCLTDELRHKQYQGRSDTLGYSSVACEAIYHLNSLIGPHLRLTIASLTHENIRHYFLACDFLIIDVCASHFETTPAYHIARRASFLTVLPTSRAQLLIVRATSFLESQVKKA